MALITCPDCSRELSDQAAACPGCGYASKKHKREIPIWAQAVALLLIPIGTTIIGGLFAWSQGGRENDAKLIEIATGVLSAEPEKSAPELRKWARLTINRYARDTLPTVTDTEQLPTIATTQDVQEFTNSLPQVLAVLNAPQIRLVVAPDYPLTAAAQETGDGPIILFNAVEARSWQRKSGSDWFITYMLAHETGHVLLGHVKQADRATNDERRRWELQADSVAGAALSRLGAPRESIRQIVNAMPAPPPNPTSPFPDREARIQAVEAGWRSR